MDSGAFDEFLKQFGEISKLAGDGWRTPWPRLQMAIQTPSGAPFKLKWVPYGSTGRGLEDGIIFQHRRLAVVGEDDWRVAGTRGSSLAPSRPSACGCVQARGRMEKS